jgi:hypothetical protein
MTNLYDSRQVEVKREFATPSQTWQELPWRNTYNNVRSNLDTNGWVITAAQRVSATVATGIW